MARQTINIVGAGLSGLTLGRCLQKRGISAILYERADSPARFSYGITLHASTYVPLLKALEVDERDFISRVAVDAPIGGSGKISDAASSSGNFRAHRGKLEEWLREGLDLRWNLGLHQGAQQVERPSDASGQTALNLDDGKQVHSDIVIGADGPHSQLQKSVLPEAQLTVLPYVVYNGKRRIPHARFDEKIRPLMQDSNILNFKHGDARINISINQYYTSPQELVGFSWTYSRPSRGSSDPLHNPERATSDAKKIPDELYTELEDLRKAGVPEPLPTILNARDVSHDRILHWLMRTNLVPKDDLKDLAKDGIVLIGDAAHAQPIVGGNGANDAIADAVSLAEAIANSDGRDLSGWVDERYGVWEKSVEKAKGGIEALHGSQMERL